MPRVPGEEGKKKEPPAYMGDPNATMRPELELSRSQAIAFM